MGMGSRNFWIRRHYAVLRTKCKPAGVAHPVAAGRGKPLCLPQTGVGRRMIVAARETSSFTATLAALRREATHNPQRPQIWRQLADQLGSSDDRGGAEQAYLAHVRNAIHDPIHMP